MAVPHSRYPHLPKDEVDIWERWLAAYGDKFELIEYDVRVGSGADPPADLLEKYSNLAREMTKRRIDAVCHLPDLLIIVEVTKHISFRTIGQYLMYPILYQLTYNPDKQLSPLLVAKDFLTDLKPAADAFGVQYELV